MMLKFGNVRKRTLSQHENSVEFGNFFHRVFGHARAAVAHERRDLGRSILYSVYGSGETDPDDVVRAEPARSVSVRNGLEIEKKTTHVHHAWRRRV